MISQLGHKKLSQSAQPYEPNQKGSGKLCAEASLRPIVDYKKAEQQFIYLLEVEDLDKHLQAHALCVNSFERALSSALASAYQSESCADAAHWFLQRVLYRINRLKFFWYDDLRHYSNERSAYLQGVRHRIEAIWQPWELAQIDVAALQQLDVRQSLAERAVADLDPPLSEDNRFIREHMTEAGYRRLLAIASLDGLVEASRMCHILGGAANEVQSMLMRVLMEEYGHGRLARKHSTFFAKMLAELGLHTEPEAYLDLVPWEVLAGINHSFLLTERKRHFLRYNGGLLYFEVAGPAAYTNYLKAAQRLGLSESAMAYWELHIREDERHGRWMLEDVALPLAAQYPLEAWELVLGYDQERLMGARASAAVVRSVREAERDMSPTQEQAGNATEMRIRDAGRKEELFCCPEESNFYSHCLETWVLNQCSHSELLVEFGSGEGSPVISSLRNTRFDGVIHGFELNSSACRLANLNISEYKLSSKYIIHNACFFSSSRPRARYLISNPPYLPAPDNDICLPLLHGGPDGSALTKQLLSLNYDKALLMLSSFSDPRGTIEYARSRAYSVIDFVVTPLEFGYYSSEPKVKIRIDQLKKSGRAFYSDQFYLLAGVLFGKRDQASDDMSADLIKVMTTAAGMCPTIKIRAGQQTGYRVSPAQGINFDSKAQRKLHAGYSGGHLTPAKFSR